MNNRDRRVFTIHTQVKNLDVICEYSQELYNNKPNNHMSLSFVYNGVKIAETSISDWDEKESAYKLANVLSVAMFNNPIVKLVPEPEEETVEETA